MKWLHLIDPGVATQIVRFVAAADPSAPPAEFEVEPALLSVVCRELNTRRQSRGEAKITGALLGGSQEEVLKDFYERSVSDVPPQVRAFIEDHLLTVSGYRDSIALENALNTPGVSRSSINRLVDRRLIRVEDRGGVQRLELTHDLLTRVVRTSRDRRRLLEAAEKQRQELVVSQQRQREEERARRLKWLVAASILVAGVLGLMAWQAYWAGKEAQEARNRAVEAQQMAEVERARAEKAVENIKRGLLIRQAALPAQLEGRVRANDQLRDLLSSLEPAAIQFGATAQNLGYRNPSGQEVYKFELFPDKQAVQSDSLAFVTYLADHPTFQNTLMTAGPDRAFRASYIGWGCLRQITALIEYADPEKTPGVVRFDMCSLIGI